MKKKVFKVVGAVMFVAGLLVNSHLGYAAVDGIAQNNFDYLMSVVRRPTTNHCGSALNAECYEYANGASYCLYHSEESGLNCKD
ncbi:MAG: hypothetical protein JEZ14_21075 [Marinilabiliaceae bacterium]|nr:hypothetical protein [Marinilabiliaceae bacterium]